MSGRKWLLIGGIVLGLLGVLVLAGNSSDHAAANRSSYIQSHGIPDTATVRTVVNYPHKSGGGYSNVAVGLRAPVAGQSQSTVYIPALVSYEVGQVLSVLVDPAEPDRSELPGKPFATASETNGLIPLGVAFLVLGALCVVGYIRGETLRGREARRHYEQWRAIRLGTAPPPTVSPMPPKRRRPRRQRES